MSLSAQKSVAVNTAAVRLSPTPKAFDTGGSSVLVKNTGSIDVELGDATVTLSTGFTLSAGDSMSVDLQADEILYGIAASATTVAIFASGV